MSGEVHDIDDGPKEFQFPTLPLKERVTRKRPSLTDLLLDLLNEVREIRARLDG